MSYHSWRHRPALSLSLSPWSRFSTDGTRGTIFFFFQETINHQAGGIQSMPGCRFIARVTTRGTAAARVTTRAMSSSNYLSGKHFFLDPFCERQWDDPSYKGGRIKHSKEEFTMRVNDHFATEGECLCCWRIQTAIDRQTDRQTDRRGWRTLLLTRLELPTSYSSSIPFFFLP